MSKKLSKYIAAFGYFDKILIALSATNEGISIISFTSVIGVPVGIASRIFSLVLSLTTGVMNKLLGIARNKKNKQNKIFMLTRSNLNSIETLVSQALIDLQISYEEFKTTIN